MKIPEVTCLPTKAHSHPLLLGSTLVAQVREYVIALRATVRVVNTAEGIVAVADHSLLRKHGGSIMLTKA